MKNKNSDVYLIFSMLMVSLIVVLVVNISACEIIPEPDFITKHGLSVFNECTTGEEHPSAESLEDAIEVTADYLERHNIASRGSVLDAVRGWILIFRCEPIPAGVDTTCAGVAYPWGMYKVQFHGASVVRTPFIHEVLHMVSLYEFGDLDHNHESELFGVHLRTIMMILREAGI